MPGSDLYLLQVKLPAGIALVIQDRFLEACLGGSLITSQPACHHDPKQRHQPYTMTVALLTLVTHRNNTTDAYIVYVCLRVCVCVFVYQTNGWLGSYVSIEMSVGLMMRHSPITYARRQRLPLTRLALKSLCGWLGWVELG